MYRYIYILGVVVFHFYHPHVGRTARTSHDPFGRQRRWEPIGPTAYVDLPYFWHHRSHTELSWFPVWLLDISTYIHTFADQLAQFSAFKCPAGLAVIFSGKLLERIHLQSRMYQSPNLWRKIIFAHVHRMYDDVWSLLSNMNHCWVTHLDPNRRSMSQSCQRCWKPHLYCWVKYRNFHSPKATELPFGWPPPSKKGRLIGPEITWNKAINTDFQWGNSEVTT